MSMHACTALPSTGLMSPMTLADAWALHQRISPDRWCVTRRELYAFVAEVRQLWLNGAIPNNRDRPNPVHDDAEHGPNLYLGISWNVIFIPSMFTKVCLSLVHSFSLSRKFNGNDAKKVFGWPTKVPSE